MVQKVIDGDTVVTDDDRIRVGFINTPESVHPTKDLNTPEGKVASKFASAILPEGKDVTTDKVDVDRYGRTVSSLKRNINGVEVDYGLVALDQEMSDYYTKYGEHPDPMMHDAYKEYYSKDVPYQFGTSEVPLTEDEFNNMTQLHEDFQSTFEKFKNNEATQDELDQITADLYGNPDMVKRYRHQLSGWNRPIEEESEYTIRGAMRIAMENDPELREQYNRAVRNGHLMTSPVPEAEPTFWGKTETSFSMLNSVANFSDAGSLWSYRTHGKDIGVPEDELVAGVPEAYQSIIMEEATKYNDQAALLLRDQLKEDIENNKVFDNMEWYAQIGYGASALIVDPLTLVPGAAFSKTGQAGVTGVRLWQAKRILNGASAIKHADTIATLGAWTAGGALEGAIINAPRLSGDHTYNAKDYQLDILFDAGFGLGLGTLVEGAKPSIKKAYDYIQQSRTSRELEKQQIINYTETRNQPRVPATPELEEVGIQAAKAANESLVKGRVAELTRTQFVPFEAITEVTPSGFNTAMDTLVNTYPEKSRVNMLMRRQKKLNNDPTLTQEEKALVTKLNADVLHIAAAFPDGKVPKQVEIDLGKSIFTQKKVDTINALDNVVSGRTASPTEDLVGWYNSLKNNDSLWPNGKPKPMDTDSFYKRYSELVSRNTDKDTGEIFTNLTEAVPKELSLIKDVIELNKRASKSPDKDFKDVVSKINGMVDERMNLLDQGKLTDYRDSSRSFGQSRQRTPDEILQVLKDEGLNVQNPAYVARRKELIDMSKGRVSNKDIALKLKEEGLTPRTSDYTKRFKQLKEERIPIEDAVNEIGRQDIYKVGEQRTVFDKDLDVSDEARFGKDGLVNTSDKVTELMTEQIDTPLLPTSFNRSQSISGYDNPDLGKIKQIRETLDRNIIKPLGLKEIKGKKESAVQQARLEQIAKVMTSKKDEVIARMVAAGKWSNLEDVIRVSHTLADENQIKSANRSATDNITTGEHTNKFENKPLEDKDIEILADSNQGKITEKVSSEEFNSITSRAESAYEKLVEESNQKVADGLVDFVRTGEKQAFALARKPTGILDYAGRIAGKITEDLGSKFQNGKLTSLEYVGSRITEIGRGYGGNIRREATGGIIRDAVYKESVMQVLPQYSIFIDKFAQSKGKKAFGRMSAQQKAGADNSLVKEFNRDVFTVQELRRQGKEIPNGVNKAVLDFVQQWDKYMDYNHNKLVTAGIGGFSADRKVKHYIPHIWKPANLESHINKHGEGKVLELLKRGYESAIRNGTNGSNIGSASELAKRQLDWIRGQADELNAEDQFLPVKDSRAKRRLDIDTTVEFEGLSILDLLDDEVASLATKYSNRMAGWIGLSESTDGMITSQLDIDTLKNSIIQEGIDKKVNTKVYEQYYDDLINMMFGRPTRGGLLQEARQLKDLTALTRMGGLGTAQAIETGQVITRSVLNTFSSDKVAKKLLAAGTGSKSEIDLVREIQSISNLTDDIEWLDRQSVHLDQHELAKVNKARQLSLWLADKATFGSWKAPASRLLGKTTGYNAIRRAQSRLTQMSFTLDVARHFKDGSGVMSNARMADLGLTDANGVDDELKEVFSKFVDFGEDGVLTKLNVDKWPESARKKFQYALIRDEAQQIQRTHVGEMPPWMNNPLMALVLQFRQMPIVANNKQLGRSLAFADKEAVTAVMLNTAIAGLVRYSKFAGLGLGIAAITGEKVQDPTSEQMQVDKYIAAAGIFPDSIDLVLDAYKAGTDGDFKELSGHMPVLGLMSDYYNSVMGDRDEQIDAAFGLLPLGNTAYGDMVHTWVAETFAED